MIAAFAMAICCGEPVKFCGTWCCDRGPSKPPLSLDPCLLYCLFRHEERHGAQCLGDPKPPKDIPNPGAWNECDSYYIQMQCLDEAAKKHECVYTTELVELIRQCQRSRFPR